MMNPRKNASVSLLIGSFPNFQSGDAEMALASYELVMRDFGIEDIEAAVTLLLEGKYPGHDGRFAPTAPQLAGALRAARDARLVSEARSRPRLAPPPEPVMPKDPRIAEGLRQQAEALGGHLFAEEVAKRRHALLARANARFAPDMSPDALMQRLGGRPPSSFEVGDPDGNTDAGEAA